jgi:flavodoxin I
MKTGIFFATNTGYTEDVAHEIRKTLGPGLVETCQNIEDLELPDLQGYDVLILGVATWDAGDLPYDWAGFYDDLSEYDFTGTEVVMFGLGDQIGYGETFLDAMGIVYRGFLEQGAIGNYGFWSAENYDFDTSLAAYGEQFCGLAIDQDNESELTSERIMAWCAQIKRELEMIRLCDDTEISQPSSTEMTA